RSCAALLFSLTRRPPAPTLFPYTTLFRSDPLLGEPVPLQLGQAGTPVQQPIDLEVEFLDVQEIGEGGNLHAVPQASCLNPGRDQDRKSTRLNSSHVKSSYAVFCLKKKKEH